VLAGAFLVLQALLLLDCVYATSEWLTERPGPLRMAALIAARYAPAAAMQTLHATVCAAHAPRAPGGSTRSMSCTLL
jgi:hypothetical protein